MNQELTIDPEFKSLIPPLASDELVQLEENILAEGCRDPLVAWNGTLIDGHNRYAICKRHNLFFHVLQKEFADRDAVMDWMDRNQLGRRNLKPDQFTLLLGRCYNRQKKAQGGTGANQHKQKDQNDLSADTAERLGQQFGVSAPTVKRAGKFAEAVEKLTAIAPDIVATVTAGKSKPRKEVVKAAELLESAPEKAAAILDGKKTAAEIAKEDKKAERAMMIAEQKKAIEEGAVVLPAGVYEVVAMDPPWNYGREYDPDASRVANPYPEMTQEQLLQLEPPFADDCVLFLWTTHAFIFDAKALMDKWGFAYKATMVWDKEKMGMGAWLRMQCEFCLVGIKGKPTWNNTKWRDIIREARREHSRKPDSFYEMVEEITIGRKLEYFSREKRSGWEVFGNDVEKF